LPECRTQVVPVATRLPRRHSRLRLTQMGLAEGVPLAEVQGLEELGWSPHWRRRFEPFAAAGLVAGRVIRSDRGSFLVAAAAGVFRATASVRLLKATAEAAELPVAGDWVALTAPAGDEIPRIDAVLERSSVIARGAAGRTSGAQALAANVDIVFVVHPLAEAPNLRRIERELALAWGSGALPVVVLTKGDLSDDPEAAFEAVASVAVGVDVVMVNALERVSAEILLAHLAVGRSALLGEQRQATREVRLGDGRGRPGARAIGELPQAAA
jgi:ribosome biogenesis GTPase